MASLALSAELPEVHVITHMTRTTISGQLDLGGRSLMTGSAVQRTVRPSQGEARCLAVIKAPQIPAIGVVAGGALLA